MSLISAGARAGNVGVAFALALAACDAPVPSASQRAGVSPAPTVPASAAPTVPASASPRSGGTIFLLTQNEGWYDVDPQRIYTQEDLAFFGATIHRSLVSYAYAPEAAEGTRLVPDIATDIGTPSDGGRTWSFTLREGLTWEDGSALVCEDVAYGVSRTFAIGIMGGGPSYAIRYLDIPAGDDGSAYPGPYMATAKEQALFDDAVSCDGDTIAFRLNRPVGDFNYATTLGMSPVPNQEDHPGLADPGEGYGVTSQLWSSGPYRVASYDQGPGGSMVLVRNERWNRASDPIRPAHPDRWVVQFGIEAREMDRRLMAAEGDDRFALQYGQIQPDNLPKVFADGETPAAAFEGRAVSEYDPYVRYFWVDVEKIPNEKVRLALGVALDREAAREVLLGGFYGDYADGLVKPSIGADYAPTGYYDDLLGVPIPPHGDPEAARQLITESGEKAPTLTWNYADTPVGQRYFTVVKESLGKAGFRIKPGPIAPAFCCPPVFDGDFGNAGWGADWPNASTVIPPVLLEGMGLGLPTVSDAGFEARVRDAITTLDREEQARKWQALNREAVQKGWIIPTFFGRSQVLAGPGVGPIYRWPAYASWPYGVMYVSD